MQMDYILVNAYLVKYTGKEMCTFPRERQGQIRENTSKDLTFTLNPEERRTIFSCTANPQPQWHKT